jgi:hypothetical protein
MYKYDQNIVVCPMDTVLQCFTKLQIILYKFSDRLFHYIFHFIKAS